MQFFVYLSCLEKKKASLISLFIVYPNLLILYNKIKRSNGQEKQSTETQLDSDGNE